MTINMGSGDFPCPAVKACRIKMIKDTGGVEEKDPS